MASTPEFDFNDARPRDPVVGHAPGCSFAIELRAPQPAELSVCRRLLPSAFQRGVLPDIQLATTTQPLRFVGAAAYELVSLGGKMAWSILLEVVPTLRRRGIGSLLVRSLIERGKPCGIRQLVARHDVADQPSAADFLRSLGFRHSVRTSMYRVDAQRYRDVLEPLRQRLVERGKVPPSTRIVGLHDAPRDAVLQFYAAQIAQSPADVEVPWPQTWSRKSMRSASVVLFDGNQVIGLGLAELIGQQAFLHYRIVAPPHRGGWANVVLCAEIANRLHASGVRSVEFMSTTQTPDTQAMIERYGSDCLRAQDRYVLPLDPAHGSA